MQKSLYDLLEVSATAGQDSIAVSYRRLHAKFAELQSSSDNEDATNQLIALREAYSTLSNPERRAAYDEKLAAHATVEQSQDGEPRSYAKLLVLLALIGACGFGYARYQSNQAQQAALDREKAAAEVRLAEIEAQRERERLAQERHAARQEESQREQEERRARYERERDQEYGRQISRDLQRQEASAQYEKQREDQRKLREEQQRQSDAERRLAQDKATLRRMEAENARRYY
ncbi:DnaJ domain-containing protein [Dechloromonas sp. CZR5]|uniref:DnaJ domain-containing protein n=1 Tax=Dechloromonas sp. CZR5 TaxID=2608630 RepID=UPI00123CBA37|nr:DnaJ domain-containing protein [Dechloromonas sp. CZR5]